MSLAGWKADVEAGPGTLFKPALLAPQSKFLLGLGHQTAEALVRSRRSTGQHEVGRQLRWDHLGHPIAEAWQVNACEQGFTAAQEDRRHRQVHLFDRASTKAVSDVSRAAA